MIFFKSNFLYGAVWCWKRSPHWWQVKVTLCDFGWLSQLQISCEKETWGSHLTNHLFQLLSSNTFFLHVSLWAAHTDEVRNTFVLGLGIYEAVDWPILLGICFFLLTQPCLSSFSLTEAGCGCNVLTLVLGAVVLRHGANLLHSQGCNHGEVECMPSGFCATDCSHSVLTWLDILNSNQRRTWGPKTENWHTVQGTSTSSWYFEEEEEKLTRMPNIVKDDLYVRKLSPVMPSPGSSFDQFLPKCWTPEDMNWKKIKRENYKPWYKEFQGFRFVSVHAPGPQCVFCTPVWCIRCLVFFFFHIGREKSLFAL